MKMASFFATVLFCLYPLEHRQSYNSSDSLIQKSVMNTKSEDKRPNILFIHGFPMSKSIWKSQIVMLQKSFNCYAIDLPGYGDNDAKNDFEHSIDSYADYVHDFMSENGIEKANIVGMSMGGSIALNLTRRYPERVQSLTIIHTSAIPDTEEEKLNRDETIKNIKNGGLSNFIENFADRLLSPSASPEIRSQYISDMNEASQDIVIAGYKAIRNRPDEFKALKSIKVPVLVVAGNDDVGSSPKEMKEIAKEIDNSTFKVIEDCGHIAPLEKPKELNKILIEWFQNI
nr:alpha/beta hydrolase [Allomuricauda sp.]|tara:strand:+ start:1539 stop:2396 length:858 start_codon:yes stop_codon:yes gene_type:complete